MKNKNLNTIKDSISGVSKFKVRILFVLLALCIPAQYLRAQVTSFPNMVKTISFQAKIVKGTGELVSLPFTVVFKLYDVSTGGSPLYTDTQVISSASSYTSSGQLLTAVGLGGGGQINLPFDRQYYLEVEVSGETMSPRLSLASTPYSYVADTAYRVVSSATAPTGLGVGDVGKLYYDTAQSKLFSWTGSQWAWVAPSQADAKSLQGKTISTTTPTTGQAMVYDGTSWAPANILVTTGNVSAWTDPGSSINIGSSTSNVQINGDVSFQNNTHFGGTLSVTSGDTSLHNLSVLGQASLASDLIVSGSSTLSNLSVSGSASYTGPVTFNNQVNFAGGVTFGSPPSLQLPSGNMYVGNASNVASAVSITGDMSINNSGVTTLSSTGVVAGTYGSGSAIPSLTIDSKGRVTSASEVSLTTGDVVAGSGVSLSGSAAGRLLGPGNLTVSLNTTAPTSVVNDSNITGSLASNVLTLGFTGTLPASRLNANVVQTITNDTNITGSISAQNLTLGFSGQLSTARGGTGIDSSSATGVPTVSAGSWSVTPKVSEALGGTNQASYSTGDILYASAVNTLSKLGVGSNGQVLTVSSGLPTWGTNTAASTLSGLTAATAVNTINNSNFAQTWNWNSATTETGLTLAGNSLTSGRVLALSSTNSNMSGNLLYVQSLSSTTFSNGAVRLNFIGAHTGNAVQIDDVTTAGKVIQVNSNSLTTGTAMEIDVNNITTGVGLKISDNTSGTQASEYLVIQGGTNGNSATGSHVVFKRPDGTTIGSISQDTQNSVSYNTASDERLKEDTGVEPPGLGMILGMHVRNYRWKGGDQINNGFFAQEVYKLYPNAVTPGTDEMSDDGKLLHPWQVDYSKFTPLLTKSIQDLNGKIFGVGEPVSNVRDLLAQKNEQPIAVSLKSVSNIVVDLDSRIKAIEDRLSAITTPPAPVLTITSLDALAQEGLLSIQSDLGLVGQLYASSDTTGKVSIEPGHTVVHVEFNKPYRYTPNVLLTLTTGVKLDWYIVKNVSTKGFDVEIAPSQGLQLDLFWFALAPIPDQQPQTTPAVVESPPTLNISVDQGSVQPPVTIAPPVTPSGQDEVVTSPTSGDTGNPQSTTIDSDNQDQASQSNP